MGVYREIHIPRWLGFFVLVVAFLILFEPWFLGMRELFRLEGFYAVQAAEFSAASPIVTAHGVAIQNAYPLYPALTALLNRGLGLEMELSLRLISVIMMITHNREIANLADRTGELVDGRMKDR